MDCLFCNLVAAKTPATILYEDEDIIAFEDIMPKAPTHFLVIPRKHISTLNDATAIDTQTLGAMVQIASTVAQQKGVSESGYRLVMNCNQDGGQTVNHIHLHVLAGRALTWPPG